MGLNIHRNSLTFILLQEIAHDARSLASLFARRGGIAFRPFALEESVGRKSWKVRQSLELLRRRGYITIIHRRQGRCARITKKGRDRLFDASLRMKIPKKRTDGRWRIISFDIPETKRRERVLLQACLRDAGFFPLQRSVYVTPYLCEHELSGVLKKLRLNKEIILLESASLDHAEGNIRRFFGLS